MKRNFGKKTLVTPLATFLVAAFGVAGTLPAHSAEPARASATSQAHSSADMRASKLIGKNVRNPQGEKLGEIKDLILDVNNDRVYYAVLEFGGFLGLGEKLFAYPLRFFDASKDSDNLVLKVSKQQLKDAPGFARDNWPDWATYHGEVNKHYGPTVSPTAMPNQKLKRSSELIGKDVEDSAGKNVGEIDDVVVNLGSGAIRYVVLDFDASWGPDDKLLALPLRTLRSSADHDKLVLNLPKDKLDMSRSFKEKRWPNINDPRYQTEMNRYLESVPASSSIVPSASTSRATSAGNTPR